jgi:ATP/ADP translocase
MPTNTTDRSRRNVFSGLFTDVRPGEGTTALLLALNVFLILMAYYVLKPVREALILGEGSAELKTYMSAGQVVLLAFVVPYYGRLVQQFARMRLITALWRASKVGTSSSVVAATRCHGQGARGISAHLSAP